MCICWLCRIIILVKNKHYLESNFKCRIFVNDEEFINISNNKRLTYDFCKKNINVPNIKQITQRPIILKPIEGCGSQGIKIIKDYTENNINVDDSLLFKNLLMEMNIRLIFYQIPMVILL